jgi:hypothetical protein
MLAAFQPPSPPEEFHRSVSQRATSPKRTPSPVRFSDAMLHAMQPTHAHLSNIYVSNSPSPGSKSRREKGWRNDTHIVSDPQKPISEIVGVKVSFGKHDTFSPTPTPSTDTKYKNVQSKLLNPTVASSQAKYKSPDQVLIEKEDAAIAELAQRENHASTEVRGSSGGAYGAYANVNSRLHEPTKAAIASHWNSDAEVGIINSSIMLNEIMPTRRSSLSPTASSRLHESTAACDSARRDKYDSLDHSDVGSPEKANRRRKSIETIHKPGQIMYLKETQILSSKSESVSDSNVSENEGQDSSNL